MLICVALKWLQFVSKSEFSPFYTVIKNTNRSGFNVFISNGLKCLGSGNTSGLTILRIKMRITLKRTGTRISAIVCILWRYWSMKFFHIKSRNLSKLLAILRSSSYIGGAAFVPMLMMLSVVGFGQFNGSIHSLVSIDVDAVAFNDDDKLCRFRWFCSFWCSSSSSPLSPSTCS